MGKHRDTPSYGWSARAIVDTSSRLYYSCSEKILVDSRSIVLATYLLGLSTSSLRRPSRALASSVAPVVRSGIAAARAPPPTRERAHIPALFGRSEQRLDQVERNEQG
jgi:hypothetical protein